MEDRSPYPWTIELTQGRALQFMVVDANRELVFLVDVTSGKSLDLFAFLTVFQRNTQITVDVSQIEEQLKRRAVFLASEELMDACNNNQVAADRWLNLTGGDPVEALRLRKEHHANAPKRRKKQGSAPRPDAG